MEEIQEVEELEENESAKRPPKWLLRLIMFTAFLVLFVMLFFALRIYGTQQMERFESFVSGHRTHVASTGQGTYVDTITVDMADEDEPWYKKVSLSLTRYSITVEAFVYSCDSNEKAKETLAGLPEDESRWYYVVGDYVLDYPSANYQMYSETSTNGGTTQREYLDVVLTMQNTRVHTTFYTIFVAFGVSAEVNNG